MQERDWWHSKKYVWLVILFHKEETLIEKMEKDTYLPTIENLRIYSILNFSPIV